MSGKVLLFLAVAWAAWLAPFFVMQRRRGPSTPQTVDRRARWGIGLQAVSFTMVWFSPWWIRTLPAWRLGAGALLLGLAILLSWTGAFTLGRQWRIDAGLNPDHELVRSGPYRVVRNPIYASMLCLLLGAGLLLTRPVVLIIAALIHITGIEIRVKIEEQLLAARFGATFERYRREVPAYIPVVR